MTAQGICSVSMDPMLALVCVGHNRHSHEHISESRRFCINILNVDQQGIAEHFAMPPERRDASFEVPSQLYRDGSRRHRGQPGQPGLPRSGRSRRRRPHHLRWRGRRDKAERQRRPADVLQGASSGAWRSAVEAALLERHEVEAAVDFAFPGRAVRNIQSLKPRLRLRRAPHRIPRRRVRRLPRPEKPGFDLSGLDRLGQHPRRRDRVLQPASPPAGAQADSLRAERGRAGVPIRPVHVSSRKSAGRCAPSRVNRPTPRRGTGDGSAAGDDTRRPARACRTAVAGLVGVVGRLLRPPDASPPGASRERRPGDAPRKWTSSSERAGAIKLRSTSPAAYRLPGGEHAGNAGWRLAQGNRHRRRGQLAGRRPSVRSREKRRGSGPGRGLPGRIRIGPRKRWSETRRPTCCTGWRRRRCWPTSTRVPRRRRTGRSGSRR